MSAPANSQRQPVAVITGASQGLGLALAEALAGRGWALVVDARRADRLGRTVARLAPHTQVVGGRRRRDRPRAPRRHSPTPPARSGPCAWS